ncbi:hypothetical protein Esti_003481 [Eimeria stiedai]
MCAKSRAPGPCAQGGPTDSAAPQLQKKNCFHWFFFCFLRVQQSVVTMEKSKALDTPAVAAAEEEAKAAKDDIVAHLHSVIALQQKMLQLQQEALEERKKEIMLVTQLALTRVGRRSPGEELQDNESLECWDLDDRGLCGKGPHTRSDWSVLCASLWAKPTLAYPDFLALVLGYAAAYGFAPGDPFEKAGSVMLFWNIASDLCPSEYRPLLSRYLRSKMGLEFFRHVSLTSGPVSRGSLVFAKKSDRRGSASDITTSTDDLKLQQNSCSSNSSVLTAMRLQLKLLRFTKTSMEPQQQRQHQQQQQQIGIQELETKL